MKKLILILVITMFALPLRAEAGEGIAASVQVGTTGFGVEFTKGIMPKMNMRVIATGYNMTRNGTESGVNYDGKLNLFRFGAVADYYPTNSKFRLTGGLFYNGNELKLTGKAAGGATFDFNGTTYTTADVGTLNTKVDWSKIAPYIGIGYGDAISTGSPWGFSFDLGAIYQGKAKATSTTSGTLQNNAAFQSNLNAELNQLESALDALQLYPVISIGVSYKF